MAKKKCYLHCFPALNARGRIREPSVLYLVPDRKKWTSEFVFDNHVKDDGDLYLCSVLTCGYPDFLEFSKKAGKGKIIAGGYHPSLRPEEFTAHAAKVVTGFGNNIDEIIGSRAKGVIRGEFRYTHMDRSVFPVDRLQEKHFSDIFPGQLTLSVNTSAGCMLPSCDHGSACPTKTVYKDERYFYPAAYLEKELRLISRYPWENLCVRDEGFFSHPEFKAAVRLMGKTGKRIYSHGGIHGQVGAETVKFLKDHNWSCVTLGMSLRPGGADPFPAGLVEQLHRRGINIHFNLFLEVGPEKRGAEKYFRQVSAALYRHMPASVEIYLRGNFPGTRSTGLFAGSRPRFGSHDERPDSGFFKFDHSPLIAWHRKRAGAMLMDYYQSRAYAALREFHCGDSLNLDLLRSWEELGLTKRRPARPRA